MKVVVFFGPSPLSLSLSLTYPTAQFLSTPVAFPSSKLRVNWGSRGIKKMEKEAKKEAFRKYLEACGVLDVLTKVLVGLYEQDEKPSSAIEFIQQKLGGPTVSEYEKLQAEMSDMQIRYNDLLITHKETCNELEELKKSSNMAHTKETSDEEMAKDL